MSLADVLVSACVTVGVWTLLLNELSDWAATANEFAPYLVFAIGLLAVVMLLPRLRHGR